MFDLSCRLSYGQKAGECGGFYQACEKPWNIRLDLHLFQVCCVLPDKLPAYNRHQRLLEYSDKDDDTKTRDSSKIPGQGRGQCGRRMTAAKRVVGGTDAAFGSFPWMALVKGGQSRCGGALIGDRSAHYVY